MTKLEEGHLDLQRLTNLLPSSVELEALEIFFKAIADPTRLKILMTITEAAKMKTENEKMHAICVHDIAEIIDMSQSAVSHQLRVLRHADLITKEKKGKHVFYTLSDNHVADIIAQSIAHISENI